MVEHQLVELGVAGSSLVVSVDIVYNFKRVWQTGYAIDCKSILNRFDSYYSHLNFNLRDVAKW